jgi:predicted ATP-grasp superfamily ATP-dependent carboligase
MQEKLNKMEKSLNHLIEQHNTLARDIEGLSVDITRMITFSTEIGNQLSKIGEQREDSLQSWKHGKVNNKLLQELKMEKPCNNSCPIELLSAVSCGISKTAF